MGLITKQFGTTLMTKHQFCNLTACPSYQVLVTFLISDILSSLRVPDFNEVKNDIRTMARPSFQSSEEMEKAFDSLCSLNNPHLSLLENLSFLFRLSQAFHFKRIVRVVAIQITKHVKMTVDDLLTLKSS